MTDLEAEAEGNKHIDEFVDEQYHVMLYNKLAKSVRQICESKLESADIKAIVTSRGKKKESLREKMKKINKTRIKKGLPCFKDAYEVRDSVHDLAGVRIALYVPNHKDRVISGIKTWFKDVEMTRKRQRALGMSVCATCEKKFEERQCPRCRQPPSVTTATYDDTDENASIDDLYSPVFAGYTADHARVKLYEDQARGLEDWKASQVVEIQVVSVLLHAWAEVEHDITYKDIKDKAGMEERQMIDCLNGQILSAEMLLFQLHQVHTNRVDSLGQSLANQHELAVFLGQYAYENNDNLANSGNLELKLLFELLKALGQDTRAKLHGTLESIGIKRRSTLNGSHKHRAAQQSLSEAKAVSSLPFELSHDVEVPFQIIESITSRLTKDQITDACNKAKGNFGSNESRYRCYVIFSSYIWLGHLAWENSIEKVVKEYIEPNSSKEEKEALDWIFYGHTKLDIFKYGAEIDTRDAQRLSVLWNWFERQDSHSYFQFAFKVSKLGAFARFPQDLRLFIKAGESKDEEGEDDSE